MPVMKLAFLFLFLWVCAATAAPSSDDLSRWAQSTEWQNLLHMQKTWRGEQSKIRGPSFFLHPQGFQDAKAELITTYQRMFQSEDKTEAETQCRFLARRDFFFRQNLELRRSEKPCQFSSEWLKRLNATRISLVFAAGYMNSAASSFGHTFLKLQNPVHAGGQELLDYGINFAARTEDTNGALYALYGLLGYFPGNFAMLPYHQLIKDYTHLEGRDLWEYELNFTPEEVRRVLFHLLELEGSYVDYYFLDDNCSFMILKALEVGRPGLQLAEADEFFVIPLDTVKRAHELIAKVKYRPSLETEWHQRRSHLGSDEKTQIASLKPDTNENSLKDFNDRALLAASYNVNLKGLENYDRWKSLNYGLQKEIAIRGPNRDDFQIQIPARSPDQGHNSSSVQIGFSDAKDAAALFGVRAAFHDQLSNSTGVPAFSHLEVLGFQWRARRWQEINPERYRILETLSTRGLNQFEKPLSWGVVAGGDSLDGSSLQNQGKGLVGYSFDLWPSQVRWTHLAMAGVSEEPGRSFQAVYGYDTRIWFLWSEKVRSLAQFQWTRFPSYETRRLEAHQAFDLTRQLELRIGWSVSEREDLARIEKTLSLFRNF